MFKRTREKTIVEKARTEATEGSPALKRIAVKMSTMMALRVIPRLLQASLFCENLRFTRFFARLTGLINLTIPITLG